MKAPHELVALRGSWVPFASTKARRLKADDPRPSLEERHPSKEEFMSKVKAAIESLIEQRWMLAADLEPQLQQASERWDWVMRPASR